MTIISTLHVSGNTNLFATHLLEALVGFTCVHHTTTPIDDLCEVAILSSGNRFENSVGHDVEHHGLVEQPFAGCELDLLREAAHANAPRLREAARIGHVQPLQDLQKARLPRAIRTHQADSVTCLYGQGDVLEDPVAGQVQAGPIELDDDHLSAFAAGLPG